MALARIERGRAFELGRGCGAGAGGGSERVLGNKDWMGKTPPLPMQVASSVAAACKSSKQGSPASLARQRARARR